MSNENLTNPVTDGFLKALDYLKQGGSLCYSDSPYCNNWMQGLNQHIEPQMFFDGAAFGVVESGMCVIELGASSRPFARVRLDSIEMVAEHATTDEVETLRGICDAIQMMARNAYNRILSSTGSQQKEDKPVL